MITKAKHTIMNVRILSKFWSSMSLRNRIAFYYTIVTSFLTAFVFLTIYFMVESIVYKQFDQEINTEVSEIFSNAHIRKNDFTDFSQFRNHIDDRKVLNLLHFHGQGKKSYLPSKGDKTNDTERKSQEVQQTV